MNMKSTNIPDRTKMFVMAIDKVKVRKHFSLLEKMFSDKKIYNRRKFKKGIYE